MVVPHGFVLNRAPMQFQRISPTELLVDAPIEAMREATWHALREERVREPMIDAQKNAVFGSTGDGVITGARRVTAQLMPTPQGTSVVFQSKAVLGGTIDFGAGVKASKKLADALERVLSSGFASSGSMGVPETTNMVAAPPIASATENAAFVPSGGPIYGEMRAPKQGTTLLIYGFLGMICCQILAPFTIAYSIGALRSYKAKGDPGDKGLVIASLVLGILGCLLIVGRIFVGLASMR